MGTPGDPFFKSILRFTKYVALPVICAHYELVFQQIEIDECLTVPPPHLRLPDYVPDANLAPLPSLRLYGVTMNGNSVMCNVHGFFPYFYVPAPQGFSQTNVFDFMSALNVFHAYYILIETEHRRHWIQTIKLS